MTKNEKRTDATGVALRALPTSATNSLCFKLFRAFIMRTTAASVRCLADCQTRESGERTAKQQNSRRRASDDHTKKNEE